MSKYSKQQLRTMARTVIQARNSGNIHENLKAQLLITDVAVRTGNSARDTIEFIRRLAQ